MSKIKLYKSPITRALSKPYYYPRVLLYSTVIAVIGVKVFSYSAKVANLLLSPFFAISLVLVPTAFIANIPL